MAKDMIKLGFLRIGDYPLIIRIGSKSNYPPFTCEAESGFIETRRGECNMTTSVEIRLIWL